MQIRERPLTSTQNRSTDPDIMTSNSASGPTDPESTQAGIQPDTQETPIEGRTPTPETPTDRNSTRAENASPPSTNQEGDPMSTANLRTAQIEDFGDLKEYLTKHARYAINEENILILATRKGPRTVRPGPLIPNALKMAHEHHELGHLGITRTAVRIVRQFYWEDWMADTNLYIQNCTACTQARTRQASQSRSPSTIYKPTRRFQLISIYVLEPPTKSKGGYTSIMVIGDAYTRFSLSIPLKSPKVRAVTKTLFERWITIFGQPENLLAKFNGQKSAAVLQELQALFRTRNLATRAFKPEPHLRVQKYNQTLSNMILKEVTAEPEWAIPLPLIDFQHNNAIHPETGAEPYQAMFGEMPFDFDASLAADYHISRDDGRSNLRMRLEAVHKDMFYKNRAAYRREVSHQDMAMREVTYKKGEKIFALQAIIPDGGRGQPWSGPWEIAEKLSSGFVLLTSGDPALTARAHVNRLRRASSRRIRGSPPKDTMFPDARRLFTKIISHSGPDHTRTYTLKIPRTRGRIQVKAENLPEIILKSYHLRARGFVRGVTYI